MKRLFGKIGALALLLLLCIAALISCGNTPPPQPPAPDPSDCTHDWVDDGFTVQPTCGTSTVGIRQYTCSLCAAVREEEVQPQKAHAVETIVTTPVTCLTDGVKSMICKNCGYTRIASITSRGRHVPILDSVEIVGDKKHFSCDACDEKIVKSCVISYADFGAVGDGVTDDSEAIRATHTEANLWGLDVVAEDGKTYYIGVLSAAIPVQTNVDWGTATFIIDDSKILYSDANARGCWIFRISSTATNNNQPVTVPKDMKLVAGQTNIGMTFPEPCMLRITNDNNKIYVRYGVNKNDGVSCTEMILVDEQGNVDPSTPIQYDYDTVTALRTYSIDDAPITVRGGTFRTVTGDPRTLDPAYTNEYYYFNRGICVERSNVTLADVTHKVEGEHETYGVPYNGFYLFTTCYNVTFRDSVVTGHRAYRFTDFNEDTGKTATNEMGSYDLSASYTIGLTFQNVRQAENAATGAVITNRTLYHGVMGSNFCRNILLDGCYLDRFDAHQGLYNATLKNSTFGFGILIIGGGTLELDNVTRLSGDPFISLRNDYNGIFRGDIVIKNCTAESPITTLIGGVWRAHDNGLPNYVTTSLSIDGLTVKSGSLTLYNISGATAASLTNSVNPLYVPTSVTVKNMAFKPTLCRSAQTGAFSGVTYTYTAK